MLEKNKMYSTVKKETCTKQKKAIIVEQVLVIALLCVQMRVDEFFVSSRKIITSRHMQELVTLFLFYKRRLSVNLVNCTDELNSSPTWTITPTYFLFVTSIISLHSMFISVIILQRFSLSEVTIQVLEIGSI